MNNWEKLKISAIAISSIVIPILVGFIGHKYTQAITEREIQGKFVELSVQILEQEPSDHTKNLRGWAVKVLDNYSGVPIDKATTKELIESVPVPSPSTKSSRVDLKPGHKFSFGPLRFDLESCRQHNHSFTCKLVIRSSQGVQQLAIKAYNMSSYTRKFQLTGNDQHYSYAHGPTRTQIIDLKPDTENKFKLNFEGRDGISSAQFIALKIRVNGQKVVIMIQPTA